MSSKNKFITIVITLFLGVFVFVFGYSNELLDGKINDVYQIYLDGEKIGLINNKDDLYALINKEQSEIKDEYNVDQVYPPKGFSIMKYSTYDNNITSVENVYDEIKNSKDFTVKGYVITVTSNDDDPKTLFRINVLDKQVFEDAINNVIKSFISDEQYESYINGEQQIVDVGEMIENIYFEENISIKETYISASEKIFLDSESLSKYLLFGEDNDEKEYTVKEGDTIASIAEDNELNVSEFLVANPKFSSESDLLAVGDKVTVSLIQPMLTLVYDVYKVEDVEIKYSTETQYDYSKDASYKEVKVEGSNGIQRTASRTQVINGDSNQGAVIDQANTYVIKEAVNEVVVRGKKASNYGYYVDDGTDWAWPTNQPYVISSRYGLRYLFNRTSHDGLDITGTGYGSPIYAIADGEVVSAGYGGMVGSSAGYNVVIKHNNGYYSVYAHLSAIYVQVGQHVSRAQKIAGMGKSGVATGTHLHLGIFIGEPYASGSRSINPELLYK